MDRSHLVLSVVFENSETFKGLSKMDIPKIACCSKMSKLSDNIKIAQDKHYAMHLFDKLEKNTIKLVFAKNKQDADKVQICEQNEAELLDSIFSESWDIQECLGMRLVAEYKELRYWDNLGGNDHVESDIMCEYRRIINSDEYFYSLYRSEHDPSHYALDGKYYHFQDANANDTDDEYSDYGDYDDYDEDL